MQDPVNHPKHYTEHPSGIECIQITEHMNFNLGNAVKYVWRAGLKSPSAIEDLKKAAWYINREIERLEKQRVFLQIRSCSWTSPVNSLAKTWLSCTWI